MNADTQSIALFISAGSASMKSNIPPIRRSTRVRMMKNVNEALPAVLYVLGLIFCALVSFETSILIVQ